MYCPNIKIAHRLKHAKIHHSILKSLIDMVQVVRAVLRVRLYNDLNISILIL